MYSTTQRMANSLRTFILMAGLTGLLVALGYFLAGSSGMLVFVGLAVAMNFAMYWFSGPMALKMSRAREVSAAEQPELHAMVAELARRAELPMPKVYVTPDEQPNAFATGRNPKHAAVAATEGILRDLPHDELMGVMAHEMAHIKNRDILIASIAAMVAGVISAIVNFLQFSLLFGGGDDESPLGFVGVLVSIILAPIVAVVIQMAISRQREYRADATGAELLGDPNPLADALMRLDHAAHRIPMEVNPASAPLYIVNPLAGGGAARRMAGLFSTHPPMEERVRRLRAMAGAVSGSRSYA